MAIYENAAIRQGRHVIRIDVDVDYTVVDLAAPEQPKWGGKLLPPNNTGLTVGHTFTLELPGFSPSTIQITSEATKEDDSVHFCGVGKLPQSRMTEAVKN